MLDLTRPHGTVPARDIRSFVYGLEEWMIRTLDRFNVRGEPIVRTPEEAFTCFMRTHMDFLCMGSFVLDKTAQEPWKDESDWKKEFELD